MKTITLDGSSLTIQQVVQISREYAKVEVPSTAIEKVKRGRECVEEMLKSGDTIYGINTGFGKLADVRIQSSELEELQTNLIRSHSLGTGAPLLEEETRAIIAVRLNSLLKGNSGVSPVVVKTAPNISEQESISRNTKIWFARRERRPCSFCPSCYVLDWRRICVSQWKKVRIR